MIKKFEKVEENIEYLIAVGKPQVFRVCEGKFFMIDNWGEVYFSDPPKFILDATVEHIDEILGTDLTEKLKILGNPLASMDELMALLERGKVAFDSKDECWYRFNGRNLLVEWYDKSYKSRDSRPGNLGEDISVLKRIKDGILKIMTWEEIDYWVKEQRAKYLKDRIDEMSVELRQIRGE